MSNRQTVFVVAAFVLAAALYSAVLYPSLPQQIPTHWNVHGQVDGWMSRTWGALLGPILIAGLAGVLFLLPWISPRSFKVEPFRNTYNYVVALVAGLVLYIHIVSLQAALHPSLDSGRLVIAGLFLLLALLGNVLGKVRRNFWVGVRTPWTLASERVWIATHRLAARVLTAAGVLGAVGLALGMPPLVAFVLLMAALFVPVLYSLLLYKRLEREGQA